MPVESTAFARARKFLDYQPVAKWSALLGAVASGVLYVVLLMVLALYAELMVNRGEIPSYQQLSRLDREAFQEYLTSESATEGKSNLEAEWEKGLEEVGLKGAVGPDTTDFTKLPPREREFLWQMHVNKVLRDRVGDGAAALVLPEYEHLPEPVQKAFQKSWQALSEKDRRNRLEDLTSDPAKIAKLSQEAVTKLDPNDQDLVWRAHLNQYLKNQEDFEGAPLFLRDRQREAAETEEGGEFLIQELSDRGILGLVVRARDRFYGHLAAGVARLAPWMWKPSGGRDTYFTYLTGLLILAVVLALLRGLTMFGATYAAALATIEATHRLRRAVYHHTFRLGTLAFRALGPSEAVGIFTRQLEAVHDGLFTWLTVVFREPIKFGLLLAFALAVNVWLALAFLGFALLVWVVGGQVAAYFRREERIGNRRAADQLALLQESLMLMRLVKCYLMELFNQSRVERQLARYAAARQQRYRGEAIYRPVLIFLGTLAAVVLMYVAALVVLSGHLGVASCITLATALVSLYLPLQNWLEHRRFLRRGREASIALFQFLDRPGDVGQVVGAEFLAPMSQSLEFDNVSLKEPGTGRKLLEGVNLSIKAGQRVAIVGSEEMEKHALVYLIPRFLDPNSGEIRIDQHNLRWVTLESLRAQIAIVLQHNLVFNDTVANNIGCGDASFDLPKIIEAAKIAHAHHFIQKLPQGYETPIGEMGHALRIGEQFRIALARAILRDPALLIVEEPFTPMDEETKDLLDDTFARVLQGRTVIFLPHRISTIRSCDQVFLLHKGKVEAAGEHRDLLSSNQLYRHLQYIEFNEFAEQV